MAASVVWIRPPSQLAEAVGEYGDKVRVAVQAVAEYFATLIQADARISAPWTDRTGNARSGLFAVAERAASDVVEVYLSHGHTINYGVYLELSRGGRYAAIMPTLERNLPQLEAMLQELFR